VESLLDLAAGGPKSCEAAQELAGEKVSELDAKIATLASMRESLQRLLATCSLPRRERECPLIQSIDAESLGLRTESVESNSTPRAGR
jgi:hypothetical protein